MPYIKRRIKIPGHYRIINRKRVWTNGYFKEIRIWVPKKKVKK